MAPNSSAEPEERLRLFLKAMEGWEADTWRGMKEAERTSTPSSYDELARKRLVPIFQDFCTRKKRPYGRVENLSVTSPSDYCTTNLVLETRKALPRRVVIITRASKGRATFNFVYVLLKQSDQGFVVNRKNVGAEGW